MAKVLHCFEFQSFVFFFVFFLVLMIYYDKVEKNLYYSKNKEYHIIHSFLKNIEEYILHSIFNDKLFFGAKYRHISRSRFEH